MENKFTVLGVDFDMATARELFKRTVEYLRGEALGTVEAVTKEMLIQGQEDEKWQEWMCQMDLLVPQDQDIFEAAGITDGGVARDVQNGTYFRLLLKYLEKHECRVFLLADDEEEMACLQDGLRRCGCALSICGQAVLPAESGQEEKVVNERGATRLRLVHAVLSVAGKVHRPFQAAREQQAMVWLPGLF